MDVVLFLLSTGVLWELSSSESSSLSEIGVDDEELVPISWFSGSSRSASVAVLLIEFECWPVQSASSKSRDPTSVALALCDSDGRASSFSSTGSSTA